MTEEQFEALLNIVDAKIILAIAELQKGGRKSPHLVEQVSKLKQSFINVHIFGDTSKAKCFCGKPAYADRIDDRFPAYTPCEKHRGLSPTDYSHTAYDASKEKEKFGV